MARTEFKPALQYSLADVQRWCVPTEIAKARAYVDAVDDLVIEPLSLSASVQGTAALPYRVVINFERDMAHRWVPDMVCTCPVELGCKHATAVLLAALRAREEPDRLNPQVLRWAEALRQGQGQAPRAAAREQLFYLLQADDKGGGLHFRLLKGKPEGGGLPGARSESWYAVERALQQPPAFLNEADLAALRMLWLQRGRSQHGWEIGLSTLAPAATLEAVLATGRACVAVPGGGYRPLLRGGQRVADLTWHTGQDGRVQARLVAAGRPLMLIAGKPAWYADLASGEVGELGSAVTVEALQQVLALPPLGAKDAALVAQTLQNYLPAVPPPPVNAAAQLRVVAGRPQPVLRVHSVPVWGMQRFRDYPQRYDMHALDLARAFFRYEDVLVESDSPRELVGLPGGETVRLRRDPAAERQALAGLAGFGFERLPAQGVQYRHAEPPGQQYALASEAAWAGFVSDIVPRLRAAGWQVEMPADFRHLIYQVEAWDAQVDEAEPGWFALDMGITVDGKRVPLAPLLHELFQRDERWLNLARLNRIDEQERVDLPLPTGGLVRLPVERLKPIARTLIDLFDRFTPSGNSLRVAALDAGRLSQFAEDARWQFRGPDALLALATRLRDAGAVQPVSSPAGLGVALRPYQLEGLAWLQHLRQHGLGGILADDMGLGKTAQTLAHLLLEKQAGRLDQPALVVLPTSLVFNWQREAAHIAPELRVLQLHGLTRASRFARIPEHDVVLTTYPLVWRDEAALAEHAYSFLILDEAQNIKNATTKAALALRRLRTRHRLCLTGTPLENHLGELWAQFDLLLPGFLGEARDFTRRWRTPIEKQGDGLRRELLARRVKPFILRRRKEEVARELPPKTEIVRSVELTGGQRDLYETLRSALDKELRETIAARGFARSQILILDALLKLRQICCDPRLLDLPAARGVKERAKIEHLMDMLPELVEEGRRILVFSQFTSMLALIAEALDAVGIAHLTLTGATRDRETPVRAFQEGAAPVFLISLKAGGVGLNLTAADTVIHVDPWWNPAAEEQATDRAHRIGQDKAVFVYKLIAAGSIEERILALQARKAQLAGAVLEGDAAGELKFDEAELASLFAPLPDDEAKGAR